MSGNETEPRTGSLITGGFRLVDGDGNTINEGDLPGSPRVVVPVEFREINA